MDWAAPQAPEKMANVIVVMSSMDFRPNTSLILAKTMMKPEFGEMMSREPVPIAKILFILTSISEQVGGGHPA